MTSCHLVRRLLSVGLTLLCVLAAAEAPENLLVNGNFSRVKSEGAPEAWNLPSDAQPWKLEAASEATEGQAALTFTVERAQANLGSFEQGVRLPLKDARWVLEARVKASQPGAALLMVKLFDASGKELRRPESERNVGTGWETLRLVFQPGEAKGVTVLGRFAQGKEQSGLRVSFADLRLHEKKAPIPGEQTLWVSPEGKNGAAGTKEDPLRRVQEGLDRAGPGTTVRLKAGVYRERVHFENGGVPGFPVVLEGEPGAILDGSDPVVPAWQAADDIGPGVWKARFDQQVITVTLDGRILTILDEKRVDPEAVAKVLEKGKNKAALGVVPENVFTPDWAWPELFRKGVRATGWSGVKGLVMWSAKNKALYFRTGDNTDPRTRRVTVAPRLPAILISGIDRCVVRGLTIRNAWQAVTVDHSVASAVEQCRMETCDHGVRLDTGSDRCIVRFNEISQDPYAGGSPKMEGWWDNWLCHKVGGFYDRIGIEIHGTVGGHQVHDNLIHDHWDGIEDTGKPGENRGLDIHHNRVFRVADDGLEPNGAGEDCRWHDNWVEESCCAFRIKTIQVGPLYAYRNIFFDNGEDYRCFVPTHPAPVWVYHNTSTSASAVTYNKVQGIGTPNYFFLNNIFWCERWWSGGDLKPNWHGEYNLFARRGQSADWEAKKALSVELGLERTSTWTESDPGFVDLPRRDVRLKESSPARGKAGDLAALAGRALPGFEDQRPVDMGAVPFGQAMPRIPRRPDETTVPRAGFLPGE